MRVFIGYDPRQPVAFSVLAHSVMKRANEPVSITRLQLSQLPIKRRGLTEFTYSRFLVPWLCGFEGVGLFLDADMLCLGDVCQMPDVGGHSLAVVKNERRFEWPSLMLFNCEQCKRLTPEFVDDPANPLYDLAWATNGIGDLPREWNQIVGYDQPNPNAKIVHYTQGIPVWTETKDCEFFDEWWAEFRDSKSTVSFADLMGNSVHARPVYERLKAKA